MPVPSYIPTDDLLKLEFLVDEVNNGLDGLLKEGQVTFELNKIPFAKFTFVASNPDLGSKAKLPTDELKKEQKITVKITSDNQPQILFKGFIKSIEKKIGEDCTVVKIECKDEAYQLTSIPQEEDNGNDNFITKLNQFLRTAKVLNKIETEEKDWEKEMITRNPHTHSWDYLVGFLDSIGVMAAVRNGEFFVFDALSKKEVKEKYTAENGVNVFTFSGTEDESKKLSKASIEYWDSSSQKMEKKKKIKAPKKISKELPLTKADFWLPPLQGWQKPTSKRVI